MKKYLTLFLFLFLVLASVANAAYQIRAFTEIEGGGAGAMDAISCNNLGSNYLGLAYDVNSGIIYFYKYNADGSCEADDSPWTIHADDCSTCSNKGQWETMTIRPGEVEAGLKTETKNIYIEDPTTETLDEIVFFGKAITIVRVSCITDTGTADINFENGANNVLTAELVCDSDEQDSCASGCDVNTISGTYDNFSQYSWGDIDISATASSPTKVSIAITYTIDD